MPKAIRKIEHSQRLERRLRVAAYARVSSGKDAMLHAQVSYYSAFIQQHPRWQYGGVYADVDMSYGLKPKAREYLILSVCMGSSIICLFRYPQMSRQHSVDFLWCEKLFLLGCECLLGCVVALGVGLRRFVINLKCYLLQLISFGDDVILR